MLKRLVFLLLVTVIFGLISCKNNDQEIDYNPNVLSAKDYVRSEDAVFEIVNAFFKGINDTAVINQGFNYIDACSVHYYPDGDSMTFGYGAVNRMCQDGKFRRGLYRAHFSGDVFNEDVIANLATDSLIVDDSLYQVTMLITNQGLNISNHPEYRVQVTSSSLLLQDTNKLYPVSIVSDFTMEWAEGYLTPHVHEDDTFLITGTASGLSSDLFEFSVTIQDPLVNYVDCFWIERGLSQITVPVAAYPTGTIDYIIADGCFNEFHFYFNDNLFYEVIK
jgi:hypothetical protein